MPPELYPRPRGAGRREQRQPARRPRRRAQDRREVDHPVRRPRRRHRERRRAITGKAGRGLREHLAGVLRNRRLNRLVGDLDAAGQHRDDLPAAVLGPRAGPPGVRRAGVPGAARPAVRHARRAGARGRRRLRPSTSSALGAGGRRRLARDARHRGSRPGCTSSGTWAGRARGRRRARPGHGRRARRATFDLVDARPRGATPRSAAGWRDPTAPKVLHDAKGPLPALADRGLPVRGRHQRHRAGGLPVPARPAQLRPGRPRPAAPRP